ncbi:MAG: chromate transporter [Halanaerobium sp.]|nr:chromate transporter [Halanaerobium sp.]
MLLFQLFIFFSKIGLFGFGGGYAMISLIQQELEGRGWIPMGKFVDLIAIAQMTPGPIAINSGTMIGYKLASFGGALVATIAVIVPSVILVLLLARYFTVIKGSSLLERVLYYLHPVVIGLIFNAALTIARGGKFDITSIIIAGTVLLIMLKTNTHPILVIVLAGVSGMVIYS